MTKKVFSIICMAFLTTACGSKKTDSGLEGNPFLTASTLEFGAPNFDQIQIQHYLPAMKEGIRLEKEEIDAIVANSEAPTFENTILALEKAGDVLRRASSVFFAIAGADKTSEIREIEAEVMPILTEWSNEKSLNEDLFKRIKAVYENERATLTGEDLRLLEEVYDSFVREGAELDADKKAQLKEINSKLADLQQQFGNKVTDATVAAGVWVDTEEELAGLSQSQINQCKKDAESAGGKAPYYIVITNTTQQSVLASLENRALRERVYNASIHRTDETSENNTYGIIVEMAKLRAQKAALLGYPNFAAYTVSNAMAKTPENIYSFLNGLIVEYLPKSQQETAEIEAYARKTQGSDFQLQPYDRFFYSAKMKAEKFNISDEQVRPYFNMDTVLIKGVFYAAEKVFGLSFSERTDLPVYHPDVKVYNVHDTDGSIMALFYVDMFRRPTKQGGAWMGAFQKQSHFFNAKPIIYNVCNVAKPAEGEPCLINWDETTTMFHEFGHALHGIVSDCKYNTLSGTAVARDFVELPSQFYEYWASQPDIFDNYVKHYQTNEPMPADLKENMLKSVNYHAAYALGENLASTSSDLGWHMLTADQVPSAEDAPVFQENLLREIGLLNPQIPPRYNPTYFRHVWGGGYAAGYYSYLWSEVLAVNVGDVFTKAGGVNRELGQAYREKVISKGNTLPLEQIFTDFTGLAQPDAKPLLKARGL